MSEENGEKLFMQNVALRKQVLITAINDLIGTYEFRVKELEKENSILKKGKNDK